MSHGGDGAFRRTRGKHEGDGMTLAKADQPEGDIDSCFHFTDNLDEMAFVYDRLVIDGNDKIAGQ